MSGAGTTGCPRWAGPRATVCHAEKEWARDDDGDGIREVHVNTLEGSVDGLAELPATVPGSEQGVPVSVRGDVRVGLQRQAGDCGVRVGAVGSAVCHHLPYMMVAESSPDIGILPTRRSAHGTEPGDAPRASNGVSWRGREGRRRSSGRSGSPRSGSPRLGPATCRRHGSSGPHPGDAAMPPSRDSDRTDGVERKLGLLAAAYASGQRDLAMSLAESIKDTLRFERSAAADACTPLQSSPDEPGPAGAFPAAWAAWGSLGWSFARAVSLFETVGPGAGRRAALESRPASAPTRRPTLGATPRRSRRGRFRPSASALPGSTGWPAMGAAGVAGS